VVTWIMLAGIVLVFLLETLAGGSTNTQVLVRLGAKVTPLIVQGEYWRLFTSTFLHIGLVHLAFNGYALLLLGTELERLFAWPRFLAIYLLSGLFGSLASYALSDTISAGASGAIFGLIGALAAFFALHRDRLGAWGRARLGNTVFLIAINLFLGFTQPGIDNLGHLGGLLAGLGLGWALAPRYELDRLRQRAVDVNHPTRYWPALLLAIILLVAGTALATLARRNGPDPYLYLGQQAVEQENWAEAAAQLEEALARDSSPDDALYFYLGLSRNHLDQPRLAAEAYRQALALAPDNSSAHWNLALTYLELDQYDQARTHFETYLELNPDAGFEVQPYLNMIDHSQ
jgi:rhomboid protease GluP